MRFLNANGLVIHCLDEGRRRGRRSSSSTRSAATCASGPRSRSSLRPTSGSSATTSAVTASPNRVRTLARWPTMRATLRRSWTRSGFGRATIVGFSIGGVIAQELYRQRPELIAALVLCDTAAKIGTDEIRDQRIADVERGGIEFDRRRDPWGGGSPLRFVLSAPMSSLAAPMRRGRRERGISRLAARSSARTFGPTPAQFKRRPSASSATRTAPRQSRWCARRRR